MGSLTPLSIATSFYLLIFKTVIFTVHKQVSDYFPHLELHILFLNILYFVWILSNMTLPVRIEFGVG